MEIEREDINTLNARVKIRLSENDYRSKVDTMLEDYRKKSRIKGFRPGKVPMGMIRKMYETAVLVDEVNKILSRSLYDYLRENKIDVLGTPLPKEDEASAIDWKNQKDFEFTYEMGLSPKIEIRLERDKISKYVVKDDPELTGKYVKYLRKRFGNYGDVGISDKEDMIYGDFTELNASNEVAEAGVFQKNVPITAASVDDEETRKMFIGLKPGDKIIVDPNKIAESPVVLSSLLGITKEAAGNFSANLQFTASRISRLTEAALNQDFYDHAYGKDAVKSEQEFQDKAREDAHKMILVECERKFRNDVIEKALARTKVPLPDDFLKRWLVKSNEEPITMEQVQEEYDDFSKSTRWQLIKNHLIEVEGLTVSSVEKIGEAKKFILNQYAQYGQLRIGDAELDDIAKKMFANEEENKNITDKLLEEKVIEYLISILAVKEEAVSYDDFVKLANKEDKKSESAFARFFKSGLKKIKG